MDRKIELEPAQQRAIVHDEFRRMHEPLPVRIVAVTDVRLPAAPDIEPALDAFYVGLFGMIKVPADEFHLFYRADNFHIILQTHNPPVRHENLAPTMIELPSLRDFERMLIDREIEYERLKSITLAQEHILVKDPAGNYMAVIERRTVDR